MKVGKAGRALVFLWIQDTMESSMVEWDYPLFICTYPILWKVPQMSILKNGGRIGKPQGKSFAVNRVLIFGFVPKVVIRRMCDKHEKS
jgi:hypothetical protein